MAITKEEAEEKLEKWMKEYQGYDKEIKTMANSQRSLLVQYQENDLVKKELELLDDDAAIFRQVGPTLLPVTLDEAKSSVNQRIDRFKEEIEKITASTKEKLAKQEELKKMAMEVKQSVESQEKKPEESE